MAPPFKSDTDAAALGSRGGRVTGAESPAKAAALQVAQASRRGGPPCPPGRWARIRARALRALEAHHEPGRFSARVLAEHLGIAHQTVGNWLAGHRTPSRANADALAAAVTQLRPRRRANPTDK